MRCLVAQNLQLRNDAQNSKGEAEKLMNEVTKARAELEAESKAHIETVAKHKVEVSHSLRSYKLNFTLSDTI